MKSISIRICIVGMVLALLSLACLSNAAKTAEPDQGAAAPADSSGSPEATQAPDSAGGSQPQAGGENKPQNSGGAGEQPGMRIFSNANVITGLAYHEGKVWASTSGGVVAWDVQSGKPTKYTPLEGLRHLSTYDVVVCPLPEPRIVVATEFGLSFFDPASGKWDNKQITPADSNVGTLKVTRLYCDTANMRLLINASGFGILDLKSGQYKRYSKKEGLEWDSAYAISVVGKDIWISSGYKYASVISGDKATSYDNTKGLPVDSVYGAAAGKDGKAWFSTSKGLMYFENGAWSEVTRDQVPGLPSSSRALATTADGKFWMGDASSVCLFDPAAGKCEVTAKNPLKATIFSAAADDQGNAWFGTWEGLLALKGGELQPMVIESDQLASNFVTSVAMDKDGKLWVASENGVQRIDPAKLDDKWELFKYDSSKPDGACGTWFQGVYPQADGSIWFNTSGSNSCKYDGSKWTKFSKDQGLIGSSVSSIAVDQAGRAWFGTTEGITIWDGAAAKNLTVADGLPHKSVRGLTADGDTMWIASVGGLSRYQNDKLETVVGKGSAIASNGINIKVVVKEPSGTYLLGTDDGVKRYDGKALTDVFKPEASKDWFGLPNVSISALALGKEGHIWVGTYSGVYHFDGSNWEHISPAKGLPATNINTVYVDQDGIVWVGGGYTNSGGGLARIVPSAALSAPGEQPQAEAPQPTTPASKPQEPPPAATSAPPPSGDAFKLEEKTGMPILDDAEIVSATKDEALNYMTGADLKTAREFYLKNMPKVGWLLDLDEKGKCRDDKRCMGWHGGYKDPKTTTFFFIQGKTGYITLNFLEQDGKMNVIIGIDMKAVK